MSNVESSEHHERSRSPPWKIGNDLLYVYKKYRQHRTGAGNGGMDIYIIYIANSVPHTTVSTLVGTIALLLASKAAFISPGTSPGFSEDSCSGYQLELSSIV